VSPFWNPSSGAVDFSYYVQQTGNNPDYIVVMFGLNETNQNNYQNAVQTFINSVRTYSTAIPIYVVEPMIEANVASDIHNGYNQQNAQYNASLCWNALTGCVHIPARTMMVDEYDYDAASLDYGYGVTMPGLADAVHPSESVGFKKIGDQVYNWLGVTS
jgi:lysophospholipase L1-like esterase